MGLFDTIANLASSSSQSNAGSTQGGSNSAYNFSDAASQSEGNSWSYSRTFGSEATAKSYAEAIRAHMREQDFYDQAKAYNALEAEKQRQFNALMGSSIYQRSVEDMKKAGINPVLAASFGLSADQVASGQSASVTVPQTYMGQTFPDVVSASGSTNSSNSWNHAEGTSSGSTWGESWQNSTSGLSTFLEQMNMSVNGLKDMINGAGIVAAGQDMIDEATNSMDISKEGSEDPTKHSNYQKGLGTVNSMTNKVTNTLSNLMTDLAIYSRANQKRNDGAYDWHYYDPNYY